MFPFILACSLLATLFSPITATSWPTPLFTTNTTLVQLGHPFTTKCQMFNFAAPPEDYYMRFYRNGHLIFEYDYPKNSSGDSSRNATLRNYSDDYITIRSLGSNLTMAELEITPLQTGDYRYTCDNPLTYSNFVDVNVVQVLPTASFTLDTTKPTVGHPFTASCEIGHFNATTSNTYTVTFYSKRDGRLATYETIEGTSLLFIHKHSHLEVHAGTRSSFPIFEVLLLETQDVQQSEFWCELEIQYLGTVSSKHWLQEPVVSFTSSAPNSTTRLGTCSVVNFDPSGREYSVQFWTDRGPKSVNQLASYTVKPNHILEFLVEEVPSWAELLTGKGVSFPNFTIQATGSVSFQSGAWWCVLGVGAKGSAGYREIVSNSVDLA